jgi:hypothetical protein
VDSADIPFGPPPSDTPPPETVPLVVPDVTHWRSGYEKSVSLGYQCHGVKANGQRCGWIAGKVDSYCFIHDPTITKEQRNERKRGKKIRLPSKLADGQEPKTIKEVLLIASARLDAYIGRFGGASTSEVEQTICDMIRTFVSVYKCSSDSEAVGLAHWSRKQA